VTRVTCVYQDCEQRIMESSTWKSMLQDERLQRMRIEEDLLAASKGARGAPAL